MSQNYTVFKFGGASIATPERMRNVCSILQQHIDDKIVVVVSAYGKTTNALEKVIDAYFMNAESAKALADEIRDAHITYCNAVLDTPQAAIDAISNLFIEIDWLIEDEVETDYSYVYDQIVSIGELASTTILNALLLEQNIASTWIDAREIIITDDVYQQANVDWKKTRQAIQQKLPTKLEKGLVVTQGFIGSTTDNNTTTLGREGSDFTGAIIANCLPAESLTIWKDVEGVLNADPNWLTNTTKFEELSYREAVEMTFYGAKVIHPKTIKPLQNAGMNLYVRSFIHPTKSGTTVTANTSQAIDQPVFVLMKNQVLLHSRTKDFSFFDTKHIAEVMQIIHKNHCDINLLQNGAVQCSFVFDYDKDLIDELNEQLQTEYDVEYHTGLELLTIRHYNDDVLREYRKGKDVLLVQQTPINFQMLYKS